MSGELLAPRSDAAAPAPGPHVVPSACSLGYRATKRALDLTLALIALVVLALPMALIGLAIRLDTPGPALFVQERLGSRRTRTGSWVGSRFPMYKFRTMVADADPAVHEQRVAAYVRGDLHATTGPASKPADDPRITRVGRHLRRWSLDELPQLLNVVRGEMSLVGPRPVPAYEASRYTPAQLGRLHARPGITGLWQVSGRCELPFSEAIGLDLEYVARRSVALDLRILITTVVVVLTRRGAA